MAKQQTVSQKIEELFVYRKIPELLRMAGIERNSPFVSRLHNLQEAIYALDLYLESNWKTDKSALKEVWSGIYDALYWFGLEKSEAKKYVRDIRKYEQYELKLRKRKLPLSKPIATLYGWKSCDVKLTRKLIYRHAPVLLRDLPEKDWKYYDLVTEVNDDVHDVYEDCETINGNRFLLSLLVFGKSKTRKRYKKFLQETGENARKRFKGRKDEFSTSLYRWTRERQRETEELLRLTLDDQKISIVEKSMVASKVLKKKPKTLSS